MDNIDRVLNVFFATLFSFLIVHINPVESNAQTICTQPPQGLISWWDAEGDANDIVGVNHGTLENGAGFATGMVGMAFSFDGVSQFVQVPDAPNLNPSNQVTVEFWMRGDPGNPMNSCCQGLVITDFYGIEGFDSTFGFGVIISTNGGVTFPSANTEFSNTDFGLVPGQWHHIAGTYDGNTLTQYVDGRLRAAVGASGNMLPMTASSFLSIGSEDGRQYNPPATANRYFHGLIDEASVYNRALSAAEVEAIFLAGNKGKCLGVPFVDLSASLKIGLGPLANDDDFEFTATAKEGLNSDGIDPLTEEVGLRFGNFSFVIPGESFSGNRLLRFKEEINGVNLEARIKILGNNSFEIRITGTGADLSGILAPTNVELGIGNNGAVVLLSSVQLSTK